MFIQLVAVPVPAFAQAAGTPGNIIPSCNQDIYPGTHPVISERGHFMEPCGFKHLLQLIRNVIRFIVLYLTGPALTVAIAYAGFLLLTSGGDTGKRKDAKGIFGKVAMGLIFMIGSWFIIEAIYSGLGYGGFLQFT